jgi:hypothetical protein
MATPVQWSAAGGNGHYYDLVTGVRTWTAARTAATASSYLGESGYLVTITSSAENAFVLSQFNAAFNNFAWIGASDAAVEGQWRWMDGPEAGVQFSQGAIATGPNFYANWGPVEPNNAGNEDVAAFNLGGTSGGGTLNGQWGDTSTLTSFGAYLVEYGRGQSSSVPDATSSVVLLALGLSSLFVGRSFSKRLKAG